MKRRKKISDADLGRALAAIRADVPDDEAVARAAERGWARLTGAAEETAAERAPAPTLSQCEDFRSLAPFYASRSLTRSRMILVEDHLRECVGCRKAFQRARREAGGEAPAIEIHAEAPSRRPAWAWAVAAAASLLVILGGVWIYREAPSISSSTVLAQVEDSGGGLFRVMDDVTEALADGLSIRAFDAVRTGKGAGALIRLADGSVVEMHERTEMSLTRSRTGNTIHLARGSLIVRAADQGSDRLYVESGDALVKVKGTTFAVNRGTKGSRVSVIEGEVEVEHGRDTETLLPGDQLTTHPSLGSIPIEQEIAWSRDIEQHLAVLHELTRLKQAVEAALPVLDLRHGTRLLDLLPRDTVIYAAIPNVSESISEAHRLFMEGIEQNPVLREWWAGQNEAADEVDEVLRKVVAKVRLVGDQLGDEIVLALIMNSSGQVQPPVILAELKRPGNVPAILEELNAEIGAAGEGGPVLRLIDDPWSGALSGDVMAFWVHGDLLVAAPGLEPIRAVAATVRAGEGDFRGSPFHERLDAAYDDGVEWLLGVDLAPIFAQVQREGGLTAEELDSMGFSDLEHLILERRQEEGVTHHRARLTFEEARRGVASWLASPAPMGTLDFISPDAYLVGAFVVKSPAELMEELFDMVESSNPGFLDSLAEFERTEGVNLLRDFAEPLGGEFAVALDGALFPVPAIKVAIEVYDPARLQESIEWAVLRLDRLLAGDAGAGVRLEQREEEGYIVHSILVDGSPFTAEYVYADGYLLAAPSWPLLRETLQRRQAGVVLRHASKFTALMPHDTQVNFSAVFYQDLGVLLGPLAHLIGGAAVTPEQSRSIQALAQEATASLIYAYAREDEILFASAAEGGLFGSDLGTLVGLGSSVGIQQVMSAAIAGKRHQEVTGP